jgi:hypothetical protein
MQIINQDNKENTHLQPSNDDENLEPAPVKKIKDICFYFAISEIHSTVRIVLPALKVVVPLSLFSHIIVVVVKVDLTYMVPIMSERYFTVPSD